MYIVLVKDNFAKRWSDYPRTLLVSGVFTLLIALGSVPYATYHYGQPGEISRYNSKKPPRATLPSSNNVLALRLERLQAQGTRLNELGKKLLNKPASSNTLSWAPIIQNEQTPTQANPPPHFLTHRRSSSLNPLASRFPIDDLEEDFGVGENALTSTKILQVQSNSWPVRYGYISSPFGWRGRRMHKGIDIGAKTGTEIYAVEEGTVIRSTRMRGYGNMVEIQHGSMYTTRYAHNRKNLVKVGEVVKKGELIAFVGATGRATGPHLHFEVRQLGAALNPIKYLAGHLSLSENIKLSVK